MVNVGKSTCCLSRPIDEDEVSLRISDIVQRSPRLCPEVSQALSKRLSVQE